MKKINLFIVILFLGAVSASAQNRNCDLSLTVISPANNFAVPFGDTSDVFVSIKNNGPDSILVSDTVRFQIVGFPVNSVFYDSIIAPGDSVIMNPIRGWASQSQTDNDTSELCFTLLSPTTFTDSNTANNESCITTIFLGSNSTSIGQIDRDKIALQIFPNPVTERINLAFLMPYSERVEIKVVDILGREVRTLHAGYLKEGSQELSFDNNLKAGIYWLKINSSHVNVVEKLIVN